MYIYIGFLNSTCTYLEALEYLLVSISRDILRGGKPLGNVYVVRVGDLKQKKIQVKKLSKMR